MRDYTTFVNQLADIANRLPDTSAALRPVREAITALEAESFVDPTGYVSGHLFSARGRGVHRAFCSVCGWNKSKHRQDQD